MALKCLAVKNWFAWFASVHTKKSLYMCLEFRQTFLKTSNNSLWFKQKIGAMEYIRELSSFWHKYDYVCKRGRRKDFSPVADIHHEVLPWHFFCLLFFLSFSQQTWYRTEAGNCHALFSASNPWQSLKWDWQRRKKAIERCVLLMSRPFKAVVFVVPLPLPPKKYIEMCV